MIFSISISESNKVLYLCNYQSDESYDPFAETRSQPILNREDQYRRQRLQRAISPARHDPFADGGKTPDPKLAQYKDIMTHQVLLFSNKAFFYVFLLLVVLCIM